MTRPWSISATVRALSLPPTSSCPSSMIPSPLVASPRPTPSATSTPWAASPSSPSPSSAGPSTPCPPKWPSRWSTAVVRCVTRQGFHWPAATASTPRSPSSAWRWPVSCRSMPSSRTTPPRWVTPSIWPSPLASAFSPLPRRRASSSPSTSSWPPTPCAPSTRLASNSPRCRGSTPWLTWPVLVWPVICWRCAKAQGSAPASTSRRCRCWTK